MSYLFSSESVTEGHPDKMADQISDAILDELLEQDEFSRVACETFITTGLVMVGGEITTEAYVDIPNVIRRVVKNIGYTDASMGFDYQTCGVMTTIDKQSPDIAQGVDSTYHEAGAGDQGMMFGYAVNQTKELMPLPIKLAHDLTAQLAKVRKNGTIPYLRPDGKSQVTIQYSSKNKQPEYIPTIVISNQHAENVDVVGQMKADVLEHVIKPVIPADLVDYDKLNLLVNPTGKFVIGGPMGDAGLTGRKIIVDTYGGYAPHGGGAFSGKDPSKVDRSGAYVSRYIAKNLVAAGVADEVTVQLAYAIGVAEPVSVYINTHGTEKVNPNQLGNLVREIFPLKPADIINHLKLRKPGYLKTASYGHFGRNDFTWEQLDLVEAVQNFMKS